MRIAFVGSRKYPLLGLVRQYVEIVCSPGDILVSGHAPGVDRVAEKRAKDRGVEVDSIEANWTLLGHSAGFTRNTTIVERSDFVLAFWDFVSTGTADTIRKSHLAGKPLAVVGPTGAGRTGDAVQAAFRIENERRGR